MNDIKDIPDPGYLVESPYHFPGNTLDVRVVLKVLTRQQAGKGR